MNEHQRQSLLDELTTYRPIDLTERGHWRRMLELLQFAAPVTSRSHYVPGHLTASAFIIDPSASRLLLHHHRRLDRWLQMGGHFELDEAPRQAALREGVEESGLAGLQLATEAIFDIDVHDIPAAKGEPEHAHFDLRFLFVAEGDAPLAIDLNESVDLRWFQLEEAERRMNEEASSRVVRKIAAFREATRT